MGLSDETAHAAADTSQALNTGDFRDRAVAVSRELIEEFRPTSLRTIPASLCLPAVADGKRELKLANWRKTAVQGLLFTGMIGSLLVGLVGTQMNDALGRPTEMGELLLIVGICGFFALGFPAICFLVCGDRLWRPFLARRFRNRQDALLIENSALESRVLRIEDASTYHKQKLSGEDLGIALLDPEHRRILIEGLSHRYVIRGEDVVTFWPLQAHEVISIRIDYLIDDQKLSIVVATTNPWFHFFWGMFNKREVTRFVSSLSNALQCQPGEGVAREGNSAAPT